MDIETKQAVLEQLYQIYQDFMDGQEICCEQFCDSCCTRNVTTTSLEGFYIVRSIPNQARETFFGCLQQAQAKERFLPRITINRLADLCKIGEVPPEEEIDPGWTPCSLLKANECSIYPFRPFGCRCLVSTVQCRETGFAQIDPFILAVNTIFQQYIEHVDAQGATGNLVDILLNLKSEELRKGYQQTGRLTGQHLLSNFALPCLMIPPEYREKVRPILDSIVRIQV